jgi:hypothetical protein
VRKEWNNDDWMEKREKNGTIRKEWNNEKK